MAFVFSRLCHVVRQKVWHPSILRVRTAYFPSWHLKPVVKEEDFEKLKDEGDIESMRLIPVKPCANDDSCSVFQDRELKKFINMVMQWGEKSLSRELVYESFAKIKRIQLRKYHAAPEEEKNNIELNPRTIFKTALANCKPVLHLVPIKKGGITYQVPVPLTVNRTEFMAMKWIITAARDKVGEISFTDQLSRELLDAYHNEGRVVRRKQDLHKICEANKAYAHYRWA